MALVLALAAVQVASDAIFTRAAAPASVPAHIPSPIGVRIYELITRYAPAPYAFDMLARTALARVDTGTAQRYALQLPPSSTRSELLGRIAQARGNDRAARHYFIQAGDILSVDAQVQKLARHDLRAAFALELQLENRLEAGGTHPDAVAESYWKLGVLCALQGRLRQAMDYYTRAVALSPISAKYLIAAGFQAYNLQQSAQAEQYFQRAIAVDPGSADAYAGAGMAALRLGDRARAQAYAARARALDPQSRPLKTLQSQLQ